MSTHSPINFSNSSSTVYQSSTLFPISEKRGKKECHVSNGVSERDTVDRFRDDIQYAPFECLVSPVHQGWIGSNGIELNSIESFSTEECPRCGAIFHLDPFGSVLSSFPYSITGRREEGRRSITCKSWPGVRSRAGNIWAKDPKEDFREFKATVSAYVDVESFWNRLLLISCDSF